MDFDGTILNVKQEGPVLLVCHLNLKALFETTAERDRFERKWCSFLRASSPDHKDIFEPIRNDRLRYRSEQLIPSRPDPQSRPGLLLVLGNPACHSIKEGMFFSYENKGREHRFWKQIIAPAVSRGLSFTSDVPVEERNRMRKQFLLDQDYDSEYRLGLSVFITFPSPSIGPWSGIAGVRKLFGAKAMRRLVEEERDRSLQIAKEFCAPAGAVVAFQKDAWNALRSDPDPAYSLAAAKNGRLIGTLQGMPSIELIGTSPTRLSGPCGRVLEHFMGGHLSGSDHGKQANGSA